MEEGGTYGKQTYRVCCKVAALLERYGRGGTYGKQTYRVCCKVAALLERYGTGGHIWETDVQSLL